MTGERGLSREIPKACCGNCEKYHNEEGLSLCRAHPPAVFVISVDKDPRGEITNVERVSAWPTVYPGQHCWEHQPRGLRN